MENQIMPVAVEELAKQVSPEKKKEVQEVLAQVFTGTEAWKKQVEEIEVQGPDDTFSMSLADTARKNAKAARISAAKIFDAKRKDVQAKKAEYDLEDKLWLKAKQTAEILLKDIEQAAQYKADTRKRAEAAEREKKTQQRIEQVAQYRPDMNRIEFESMLDETFEAFLEGLRIAHEQAEAEKIAAEKAAAAAEEARKKELAEAKAAAEAAKEELKQKMAAAKAEHDRIDAQRKKDQQEYEKRIKAEMAARQKELEELDRIKAEAKAKAEAEAKAKAEAEQAARELAEAPEKEQLRNWIQSFELPEIDLESEVKSTIVKKFKAFKKWAEEQI